MTDLELLEGVKDYIERYMFEGSLYHLDKKDHWVKQLYTIVEKQQKEIERLENYLNELGHNVYWR